jgi:hypothetical protein
MAIAPMLSMSARSKEICGFMAGILAPPWKKAACKPRLFKPVDYFDHTTCYSEKTGLRLVLTSHMGSNPTTHPKFPRRNICDNTGHLTYSAGHAEESISFAKHNMGTYARESGFSIRSSNTRSRIDTRFAGQWPWRGCYEDSEISG